MEAQALPLAIETVVGLATLLARRGKGEQASKLLGLVLHYPTNNQEAKNRAIHLLTELQLNDVPEVTWPEHDNETARAFEDAVEAILNADNNADELC